MHAVILLYFIIGGLIMLIRMWNLPDSEVWDKLPMLLGALVIWPLYAGKFAFRLACWSALFIWYCLATALDDVWHI